VFEGILQPTHLILILIIVLVVFGPGKLPEVGGAIGKGLSEFKRSVNGLSDADKAPKEGEAKAASDVGRSVCPACGHENAAGNQFCGNCGAKIV
jgi:sec-independent protein translocase protein TatA